jgi:HEAT repeat protein
VEALLGNLRKKEKKNEIEFQNKMENLKELALFDSEEAKLKILEEFDKEKDLSVIANIIKITGNLKKDGKLYNKIIENLDKNNTLKVTSLEVLAMWGDEECLKTIFPFIFEKENIIKSTAILAVIKISSDPEELAGAIGELIAMLKDEDVENRITGLAIIGELGSSCFIPTVSAFFQDNDIKVRESAVNVASKLKAPSLMEDLLVMLKEEENKEIYDIIYKAIESIRHNNFEKLLFLTGGLNSEDKKNVITNLKKIENYTFQDISLKALSLEDKTLAVKIIELLERYKDDRIYIHLLNDCFVEKDFSPLLLIVNTIRNKNINEPPARLLKDIASNRINQLIAERLVEIINESKEYDREFIRICFYITGICSIGIENAMKAFENILSGETTKKDIAIEIIDTGINDKNLKSSILKLVSNFN